MAGFFEKFGAKVANVVDGTTDAVGDFAQESKLKLEIRKYDDIIREVKQKFGSDAVEARMRGEDEASILAKLDAASQKIREVEGDIAQLNAEIQKIKENKENSSSDAAGKGGKEL